jgi:response regulator of citrate/malate metabolism
MKIFVLEDDLTRLATMKKKLYDKYGSDLNIIHCETAKEAKAVLVKEQPFDLICLDHDLGGEQFLPSEEENTGYQVAVFMAENKIQYTECIIHSLNFPGATRMWHALGHNAKCIPILLW